MLLLHLPLAVLLRPLVTSKVLSFPARLSNNNNIGQIDAVNTVAGRKFFQISGENLSFTPLDVFLSCANVLSIGRINQKVLRQAKHFGNEREFIISSLRFQQFKVQPCRTLELSWPLIQLCLIGLFPLQMLCSRQLTCYMCDLHNFLEGDEKSGDLALYLNADSNQFRGLCSLGAEKAEGARGSSLEKEQLAG